jgi:large subunit ribosomal protein L1
MDKEKLKLALSKVKECSNKRNFIQSIDLIVTLKDFDLKKSENQIDMFVSLHHSNGKKIKVCGLVGPEMKGVAANDLDFAIDVDDFEKYSKDKKLLKKLAEDYDFFVAQATLMPKVAQTFGRVLGPRNKMPNPKAGCVVPPNVNLLQLKAKLMNTVRVTVKLAPQVQVAVGKEDMDEEIVIDNALTIYNQLVHHLPNELHNVKDIMLKMTMGPAVKIGADIQEEIK